MDGRLEARPGAWDGDGDSDWDGCENGGERARDEVVADDWGFGSLVCALSAATEDEWTLDGLIRASLESVVLESVAREALAREN